ncbi:DNA/RNA polymerases superfamily protein [Senna tora]|uniref:DNA/RNA polymerases superfamily protein n=1 Tax=Senna tora TaxID=362788 RepID=A0A834T2L3_9FABA|nr:DNA/RNA polymerases superfamily protein [Senna tora]
MSQREGIVEDVNDESSAHHEAPPPPEGRGRGRSSGSNRGRGRARGLQGVTRAVEALTSIIVDHVARTNTPAGEASRQVQRGPPGPQIPLVPQIPQEITTIVTLPQLLKLKPPTFSGSDANQDPEEFIDDVERVCEALGCSGQRSVELVSYQLRDVARSWGTSYIKGRQVGALPLDWGEFKKDFLERFLPESVREARAREFLLFKQTSEMTVAEYSTQLIRLSKYAPNSTSTERELIKRFVQGLLPPLFRAMVSQINQFESYAVALDCATRIEMREKEEDDAAKKRKRGGEDRYGGSSTGGFSKGTKAHTHQRFSQSPSGFSASSYVSPNRQRTDPQNTKSSTQQGSSQQKHNKSSCPTCEKFHSGVCYRGSGACYRCGKVGHLIRDCPQQRPESSQGSIQPTGHTTSSMGQSRGPSSNRSSGNDASRDSRGRVIGGFPATLV